MPAKTDRDGKHNQRCDVSEDGAADADDNGFVTLSAVTAHDWITQRRVCRNQGADQQAGHQWIAEKRADGSTRRHAADKVENTNGQRPAAHPVEFLEVDLQAHDEEKVDRADIRDELQGFTLRLQKIENTGAHQDPGEQEADKIRKPCASEQGRNQHCQCNQQGEGTEWLVDQMGEGVEPRWGCSEQVEHQSVSASLLRSPA